MAGEQHRRGWSPVPEQPDPRPWYRQFWPWFLIALPLSSVIAGLTSVWISMQDPDGLVRDDYYKAGLAINERLEREANAEARGLQARMEIDFDTGDVLVDVEGELDPATANLDLALHHATRAHKDVSFDLRAVSERRFVAQLEEPLPAGNWDITLKNREDTWRVVGRVYAGIDPSGTQESLLQP